MPKIMALNTTCASIGSTMTDADASASAVAQGLSSMFTTLCSNTSNTLIGKLLLFFSSQVYYCM